MNEAIVAQIRKILARTEGAGCTSAEAEAAFAMASRKLAEHNLTMEDVAASTTASEESWVTEEVEEMGRWMLKDNLCYGILKEFYFVECILNPRNGGKVFTMFGTPENVAVGTFIWSALHASFDRCWTMYRYLNKRPANEKRLFVSGMAKGFTMKLREERAAMVIERDMMRGGGTALALTSIADKTALAFKLANPKTKTRNCHFASCEGDRSTLSAGVEAGRALNLNRALNASGRKAIG